MMKIKKGDTVRVIAGKDKDKEGKVILVDQKNGRVVVEGINMVTKHVKPRRQGEAGGIVKAEGAFYACKAMLVCPSCGKATRVAHKVLADGTKTRVCKKCNATFDVRRIELTWLDYRNVTITK